MALSPIELLALSLQQYKGMFALLVGSGISRSAGIPTGWDIVLDLINRLAASKGQDTPEDPVGWYRAEFNREPDYSDIINTIATTREQRVQLLRQYFEPTEEEREEGLKQPTAAHRAIAQLVSDGFVKVIITTNFDRLLERAIEDKGITPAIVAGSDAAEGVMPLQHVGCLIFKIHGDYFDTRIRNVTEELEQYDPPTTALLSRIISEYGLVICGWSGLWDIALGDSILRNAHLRFPTFWLSRGAVKDRAKLLFDHRRGALVTIDSADIALPAIAERASAIEATQAVHPASLATAVALSKRYLAKPTPHIEFHDLLLEEMERRKSRLSKATYPVQTNLHGDVYAEYLREREAKYREEVKLLVAIAVECIKYGETRDIGHVYRSIKSIATRSLEQEAGNTVLINFQSYPASLLFYSVGLSAVLVERYELLAGLYRISIDSAVRQARQAADLLHCSSVMRDEVANILLRLGEGAGRRHTPASDWMANVIPDVMGRQLGSDVDFETLQNRFELILTLFTRQRFGYVQPGRFLWFGDYRSGRGLLHEMELELQEGEKTHPLFLEGVLDTNQESLTEAFQAIKSIADRMRW